jgi:apolipoprotein N-acyltransferase
VKSDAASNLPPLPDYDNPPVPFMTKHGWWAVPFAVVVATVVLTVLSFPGFDTAEFAYAFAAPAILWAYRRPAWKIYAGTVLGANAVAWTIVLAWLHHVTWGGLLLLGPIVGVWVGSWFLVVRWVVPDMPGQPMLNRLLGVLGLAGAWVVIEWTRTWVLSGFPWLPLAASQWQRPSILQIAAYTGAGGVSFILIAMNHGFAAFAHRLIFERAQGLNRRSQEFLLGMFLLIASLSIYIAETVNRGYFTESVGKIGFVQPYVPQAIKWDRAQEPAILEALERTTLDAARRRPDLILWPEAVTPWAIRGGTGVREWTERLVAKAGAPLLLGSIAIEPPSSPEGEERWFNGAFLVHPQLGLSEQYYAKRHLVPFGEYVPLRPLLGWLEKFVPIGGDFIAGQNASPMYVVLGDKVLGFAPLICYEDIFPSLARSSVRHGADVLVVLTNNAWYGEGGAAYQHAAHSVLRAVETRRPVLRSGNGGWSGWIDEFGSIRAELRRVDRRNAAGVVQPVVTSKPRDQDDAAEDPGTIYFRGSGIAEVIRDSRWAGRESVYVRFGDWFVLVCLGVFWIGAGAIKLGRAAPAPTS